MALDKVTEFFSIAFIAASFIYSKEKESSHMHRLTIKNLSSLVGKLSSSIEDNVVERTARQMSSSPVTGYTPNSLLIC
jgi:proline dehydrogenase